MFRYGIKGILLGIVSIFPHYLCYLPAMILLLRWCEDMHRSIYFTITQPGREKIPARQIGKTGAHMDCIGLRMFIGMFCESCVIKRIPTVFETVLTIQRPICKIVLLFVLSDIVDQTLTVFPAQTGIGDGLTVAAGTHLLVAFLDVALDHDALDQLVQIGAEFTAVHDFLGDTDLLPELLVGVGVVRIDHAGRILQIHFFIHIPQTDRILVMVVGDIGTVLVGSTAQYGVCRSLPWVFTSHPV